MTKTSTGIFELHTYVTMYTPDYLWAVHNHWTELMDWNGGMDQWAHFKTEFGTCSYVYN